MIAGLFHAVLCRYLGVKGQPVDTEWPQGQPCCPSETHLIVAGVLVLSVALSMTLSVALAMTLAMATAVAAVAVLLLQYSTQCSNVWLSVKLSHLASRSVSYTLAV